MVDWVVEIPEFSLGVRQMKAVCIDTGVEGGKQVIWEQVATGKFTPGVPGVVVEHTQMMHASVNAFMETYFTSYFHLGEIDMEGLRRLCNDYDAEDNLPKGSSSKVEPSSNPLGQFTPYLVIFKAINNDLVRYLGLSVSLGVYYKGKPMMDLFFFTSLFEVASFEFSAIVSDHDPWSTKSCEDAFPHEFYHLSTCNGGQVLDFDPLDEIVNNNQKEICSA
ncbi:unnamed protein product [Lactuca saligna]|uniref:Uncharacterized protein n=1 Tax=Lactuca saligna TaxID=75948 RepID=A0AA35ZZS3_LACSI|nr:unnamed protein product [Lactuca saligna]